MSIGWVVPSPPSISDHLRIITITVVISFAFNQLTGMPAGKGVSDPRYRTI